MSNHRFVSPEARLRQRVASAVRNRRIGLIFSKPYVVVHDRPKLDRLQQQFPNL